MTSSAEKSWASDLRHAPLAQLPALHKDLAARVGGNERPTKLSVLAVRRQVALHLADVPEIEAHVVSLATELAAQRGLLRPLPVRPASVLDLAVSASRGVVELASLRSTFTALTRLELHHHVRAPPRLSR